MRRDVRAQHASGCCQTPGLIVNSPSPLPSAIKAERAEAPGLVAGRSWLVAGPGFTLIELLLASALTTLLLGGVLAVVADLGASSVALAESTGRDRDASLAAINREATIDAWGKMLADDLTHASVVYRPAGPSELHLAGFAGLGQRDRGLAHQPAEVIYRLEAIGDLTCIVRRQTALADRPDRSVQRDLVATGIGRFELALLGDDSGAHQAEDERGDEELEIWFRRRQALVVMPDPDEQRRASNARPAADKPAEAEQKKNTKVENWTWQLRVWFDAEPGGEGIGPADVERTITTQRGIVP